MASAFRRSLLVLLLAGLAVAPLCAEEAQGSGFGIGMGLGIGVQTFNEPGPVQYQSLALTPDFSIGKFGIGIALTLNYRFVGDQISIRQADWVPTSLANFFEIYLPKIMYVRWGQKGEPLFVKAGSMDDMSLGNGFIMGDYSNVLFLPARRIFGLAFDMDGGLFGFPYVGVETIVGDLAALDVLGGRLYVRPLVGTEIPVAKNLELGATFVADTRPNVRPDQYASTSTYAPPLYAYGGDFRLPLVYNPVVSLATFGDADVIGGSAMGGMLGFGGRLIGFLTYGAQFRVLGPGFIPGYFGATYDLFKPNQYATVTSGAGALTLAWLASLGTSFLDDKIVFNVSLDGPFARPYPTDPANVQNYPHLRGIFLIADGIIPGISFDFTYDKKGIGISKTLGIKNADGTDKEWWNDLVSAENAAIQAALNYKTGPAIISFVYNITYAPGQTPEWVVTSGLQSQIKLF